jgi:hypothetical protein
MVRTICADHHETWSAALRGVRPQPSSEGTANQVASNILFGGKGQEIISEDAKFSRLLLALLFTVIYFKRIGLIMLNHSSGRLAKCRFELAHSLYFDA